MLHQAYLLEIDAAQTLGVLRLPQRTWWPSLVVPRALCVFESVPCRGLAWRERKQFARTQAKRLAPFANFGFNACVRSGTLMLWFWDQSEVQTAAHARGLNPLRTRLWAEPLLRQAPAGSGQRLVACDGGSDEQTLAQGAIVASRWMAGGTLPAAQRRRWPWGWELSGQTLAAAGDAAPAMSFGLSWPSVWRTAGTLALVGTASFAAFWGAQVMGAREQLLKLQNEADGSARRLGDLASLRSASNDNASWVNNYAQLSMGIQAPQLLKAMSPVLERYGVVMKELEIREDEVKLVLTSAGSDIDLPALLKALKAIRGVHSVQLRAGLDFSQATFSLRAPGYMRSAGMSTQTETR